MPWEAFIVRHVFVAAHPNGRFGVASREKVPTPLKRVWVIWEIFCAYQTGARFDIAMSLRCIYAGKVDGGVSLCSHSTNGISGGRPPKLRDAEWVSCSYLRPRKELDGFRAVPCRMGDECLLTL